MYEKDIVTTTIIVMIVVTIYFSYIRQICRVEKIFLITAVFDNNYF